MPPIPPPQKNIYFEDFFTGGVHPKSIIQYAPRCIFLLGELITSNAPPRDFMQTQSFTRLDVRARRARGVAGNIAGCREGSQHLAEKKKNIFASETKGY